MANNESKNEAGMTKLGVQEDTGDQEALEKKAIAGCPMCGRAPVRQGTILLCPEHGTEPWEG